MVRLYQAPSMYYKKKVDSDVEYQTFGRSELRPGPEEKSVFQTMDLISIVHMNFCM